MALITLKDVDKSYRDRHLLRGVSIVVGERDRIGLVGPNGCGKSTLLRLLAGTEPPDEGERTERRELRIGCLSQAPEIAPGLTARQAVIAGFSGRAELLAKLDAVHERMANCTPAELERLLREQAELDHRLEQMGGHDVEHRVESMIHDVGLPDPDASCDPMSGGELRRVALARLLLSDPEILLLDEPTNHLDAEVIAWLEDRLRATRAALILVTHDRYFLDRVVDEIIEIDRGQLFEYDGSYTDFVVARAERLEREARVEATRLNLLRREAEWIRRSPPARTSKSKSRIQRHDALVAAEPEQQARDLAFRIPCGTRLGERVLECRGLAKSFGDRAVIRGLDFELGRGERLGIVGPNGAGKSTLLALCMGSLEPDAGEVTVGSTVRYSFIDQSRTDLDPAKTVRDEVGGSNDHVVVDGRPRRIETYLEQFLFPGDMQRSLVGDLSGGERSRVLLAKLLAEGGNVVVLDEPTNDLDLMTLRVLEEALAAFEGSALVVSHDRYFLDRVATRILYLDAAGGHRLHAGDMSSLLEKLEAERQVDRPAKAEKAVSKPKSPRPRRLSSRERRELDELPEQIEAAESELSRIDQRLADPELYQGDPAQIEQLTRERARRAEDVAQLYERWEQLGAIAEGES